MEQQHRHRRNSNILFNPNNQGLSTYNLTYVTADNSRKKAAELLNKDSGYKTKGAA